MSAIMLGGIPYSQLGELQVINRPLSGVPATAVHRGPWAIDPVLEMAYVEDAGLAIPSTAVNVGGYCFTPDGALYVTPDTTTGPFTHIGGFKVRQDGAVCIITKTPSPTGDPYIGGAAADGATGAMVVGGEGFGFIAPLMTTLRPTVGVGGPTYTRATIATVTDWESIVRPVLSGEARFQGARRVRNYLTFTEDFSNAAWGAITGGTGLAPTKTPNFATAPDGTTTACRIQADIVAGTLAADFSGFRQTANPSPSGTANVRSVWIKSNTGASQSLSIAGGGAAAVVTATTTWQRLSVSNISTSVFDFVVVGDIATSKAIDILVWHPQYEDTTGQSNTNPSEYVSVSVLSAPYHGANVDGVKYFATQNGNTVASNVVTEAGGAAISSSTLLGYLAEGARTNLCLQSEDFSSVSWTKEAATVSANAAVAPDGTSTADKIIEDITLDNHSIFQNPAITGGNAHTRSVWLKSAGRTWAWLGSFDGTTEHLAFFNLATGVVGTVTAGATAEIKPQQNGWYRCSLTKTTAVAATNVRIQAGPATGDGVRNYTGDGASGIYGWGGSLEAGSFASTYIPTTTASVTRNADVLTYASAGNISGTAGTCYAELSTEWTSISANNNAVAFGGGRAFICQSSSTGIQIYDGTNMTIKNGLTDMATDARKRASSWGASGTRATGDGVAPATGSFDGDMGVTALQIGHVENIEQWFGTIRNVRISKAQLSDAFIETLTT